MNAASTISRRSLIAGMAAATLPSVAAAASSPILSRVDFRGSLSAGDYDIQPGGSAPIDRAFSRMLMDASDRNQPVFLPPGDYRVSGVDLPANVRIQGVAGATRLVYTGDGRFLSASGTRRLQLCDLVIDGANRWLADDQPGLVTLRNVASVRIDNCELSGASKFGLWIERCSGRLSDNIVTGAAEAGIYAVECSGLEIRSNTVTECGNGGILVHRWTKGHDGTIVSANRVRAIRANGGGTGQNGNGINIFRADGVKISDNHVSDCAFTAIRSNAGSDVQITDNQCINSGEMAIYSEFGFEGAIISGNLIDGAANGISACNFNEGGRLAVISGNMIRNLRLAAPYTEEGQYFGIGIQAEAETVVSGNVLENIPRWAMVLGWGPFLRNVSVTGNVVRRAPVGCAVSVVDGAGSVLIRDNLFSEIGDVAVGGFHWAEKVTGELAADGAATFNHIGIGGNRTG